MMKELLDRYRAFADKYGDLLAGIALVAVAGAAFEIGRFGMRVLQLPVVIGLAVGLAIFLGNEGSHSIKRLLRTHLWPLLRRAWHWLLDRISK